MSDENLPKLPSTNGVTLYRQTQSEKLIQELKDKIDDLQGEIVKLRAEEIRDIKVDIAKMQERLTLFQAAQAIFTTIAGVVAAFIGRIP